MNTTEILETVRTLGRDKFLPRTTQYDTEGTFPTENYADLRDAGLLELVIPKAYGGMGVDYATYAQISAEMGYWCGATALTFNMHCSSMLWSGLLADDLPMTEEERNQHHARRGQIYAGVIEQGHIFAQPFSEPNSAAAAGRAPFGTEARAVDGG